MQTLKSQITVGSVVQRKVAVLCFGRKLLSSDSETGTERGQQWGRGTSQECIVTAVRIRQSDCRHSKQDVTYPSAGILLLRFSSRPRRRRKKKKSHRNILWDHSSKASDTQDGTRDASSYPYMNTQSSRGAKWGQLWATCGQRGGDGTAWSCDSTY